MSRFPADLPQSSDVERVPDQEAHDLLALAEELRSACPDPSVSADFAEGVRQRLARRWTLWRTIETSRLARAVATLLVIVVGIAPVIALARMLPWFQEERPTIGFVLPKQFPVVTDQGALSGPDTPAPPDREDADPVLFSRMERAAQSWRAAGPTIPDMGAAPRIHHWPSAAAEELWQEFLRRCTLEQQEPVPPALAARVL